jgi:hypothetical protein
MHAPDLRTDLPVFEVLQNNVDTSDLDRTMLDEHGGPKVVPAAVWRSIPGPQLRLWCHRHGFYGLPTTELVAWLRRQIDGRRALEIGAGNGSLGRALGIDAVDNHSQTWPAVALHYASLGQPVVRYGPNVEREDALEAVRRRRPQVVIGQWVTQYADPLLSPPPGGGAPYGIREIDLIAEVETYIVVGNLAIHGRKNVCVIDHAQITPGWVVSRSATSALDCLLGWGELVPARPPNEAEVRSFERTAGRPERQAETVRAYALSAELTLAGARRTLEAALRGDVETTP